MINEVIIGLLVPRCKFELKHKLLGAIQNTFGACVHAVKR